MSELLSGDDLAELTGTRQRAAQRRVLDEHGIFYVKRIDGMLMTTWHHVNHPIKPKPKDELADEPNWDAMREAMINGAKKKANR